MSFKAILNNLIVKVEEENFDNTNVDVIRGEVQSVGDEVKHIDENDQVIFGKYSGQILNREDDSVFIVLNEQQILAIYE